ncbi:MAG: hypothetical protein QOG80_3249 [Pseudonocardiales bacterium]|nr:hypothetical protein [Pseudonocardiales bacterium]
MSLDSLDAAGHSLTAAVVDRQVLLSGRYDAEQQRLIAGHSLGGSPVLWVLTPLRLSDGSMVEVVRGWMSSVDRELENPPASLVTVTGRIRLLQPTPVSNAPVGPGYASAIDAGLLRQLPQPTRDGYVVRTAQNPPDPLSLQPVPSRAPPGPTGASQFYLLSAVYSVQWWFFGVLVICAWLRLFMADLRDRAVPSTQTTKPTSTSGPDENCRHERSDLSLGDGSDYPVHDSAGSIQHQGARDRGLREHT